MIAHDTNVWIYLYDARDPVKQKRVRELMEEPQPFVLLWQVGCEFIAACRKLEPFGFGADEAWSALGRIRSTASVVAFPSDTVWDGAQRLQESRSISIWDALIVSACLNAGVSTLYSEDLTPGLIDGLLVVNPFLDSMAP
jgi:predicted nucleic acid-binding protein